MTTQLDNLEQALGKTPRNYDSPPLEKWHPELSGDIDIFIDEQGHWFHEDSPIVRDSLVRVFASILRREQDGEYYLVTPVEKWRIRVALHPLIVVDVDWQTRKSSSSVQVEANEVQQATLWAELNTGKRLPINRQHPLRLEARKEHIPYLELPHGLSALFARNAWYRLVDLAQLGEEGPQLHSGGEIFDLAP